MADLAASDVTVTFIRKDMSRRSRINIIDLTFGDGAKTVPSAGIPLPAKSLLGCPTQIDAMMVQQHPSDGLIYKYDRANHKMLVKYVATHAHNLLIKGGTAAAGTDAVNVKTAILGKEAATDATVLGADSATKGGVIAAAAAELGAYTGAPASMALRVVVFGK